MLSGASVVRGGVARFFPQLPQLLPVYIAENPGVGDGGLDAFLAQNRLQLRGVGILRTDTPTEGIAGADCDDKSTAASSGEENSSASAISVEVWRTRQMLSAN